MTPAQIKACLEERQTSLAAIARDLKVTQQMTSNVIRGCNKSERVEKAIAKALGKQPWEVFPDRYPVPTDAKRTEMVQIARSELADMRAAMNHAIRIIDSARELEIA